jgi:hypothetical protein
MALKYQSPDRSVFQPFPARAVAHAREEVAAIFQIQLPTDNSRFGSSRLSIGHIRLNQLVGAARFELTTPCAQGRFRPLVEIACFLMLMFQADAASLLRPVERFGSWRLRHPHFYLHPDLRIEWA